MRAATQWFTAAVGAATLMLGLAQTAPGVTATGGDFTTTYTFGGTVYRSHVFTNIGLTNRILVGI